MKKIGVIMLLIVSLILPQTVEASEDYNPYDSATKQFVNLAQKGYYVVLLEIKNRSDGDPYYIVQYSNSNPNPLIQETSFRKHYLINNSLRYYVYYDSYVQSLTGLGSIWNGTSISLMPGEITKYANIIRTNFDLLNTEGLTVYNWNYISEVTDVSGNVYLDWGNYPDTDKGAFIARVLSVNSDNVEGLKDGDLVAFDVNSDNSKHQFLAFPRGQNFYGNTFNNSIGMYIGFSYTYIEENTMDYVDGRPIWENWNKNYGTGNRMVWLLDEDDSVLTAGTLAGRLQIVATNKNFSIGNYPTDLPQITPSPIPTPLPFISPTPLPEEEEGIFNLGNTIKRIFLPSPDILYNEVNGSKDLLLDKLHIDLDAFKPVNGGRPSNVTMTLYGHNVTLLDFEQIEELADEARTPINIVRVFVYIFSLWGLIKFIIDYFDNRGGGNNA